MALCYLLGFVGFVGFVIVGYDLILSDVSAMGFWAFDSRLNVITFYSLSVCVYMHVCMSKCRSKHVKV